MMTVNFHTKVDVFTKSVSGIPVLSSAGFFLAHTFREYGGLFTSGQAHTRNPPGNTAVLTKTVNEVSL